jgi:hypothetical protein
MPTPVGGSAAQSEPAIDLDDDLAIPVEGSPPPNTSFAGVITLPPEMDDALALPVAAADPASAFASDPVAAPGTSPVGPPAGAAPLAPALPFAPPRGDAGVARFDEGATVPRPMPRASTDTTPLPPPPMSVVPAPAEHPRVPSEWLADRGDSRPVRAATTGPSPRKDLTTDEVVPLARGGAAEGCRHR